MSKYTSKLSKLKITAMMLLILLASIWFALASQPVAMKRESAITPDLVVMRSLSLDEALNESLAAGDYRRVRVDWGMVA